jgi:hypothetical protein
MKMLKEESATETPTQLFFEETKKMPWVVDIYIAIQSAIALGRQHGIDFNLLANDIMPRPDRDVDSFMPLEGKGIEALKIIYDCECIEQGPTDYHEYKFTRKSDGKSVIGTVKI